MTTREIHEACHLLTHRERYGELNLIIGARESSGLLYATEYDAWRDQGLNVHVTIDRADSDWHGAIGGAADGLFINTSGVGELMDPVPPGPQSIQVGDKILVSGSIGRHGIAVMSVRDGFAFEPAPLRDSGSVIHAVASLRNSVGEHLRTIRDATRGGVSAVLHEWTMECGHTFTLTESRIPVTDEVRGACELLGLDPLYVANEGTIVVAVDPRFADIATTALRRVPGCEQAAIIGEVQSHGISPVTIRRIFGASQPLDEPSGAPLPRIC